MKLLRMTATFGRLEQETLSLTEGLNVLQMPNEAGKSTWAEFLLAMLYGVDTSEREKTGVLPVKTKYQPWSGKPMEGVIELEHAGRRITLTRTSTARAPLGVFSAVYTDSGLPVEGMTGANCGETLLGVPKRVYQRSAFVRQAGLGLTPDDELEARLSALVTTGDEAVSFAAADKRLLAWQNRVRHNKTGLIPDAERELAAVDSALAALAGEHEKNLALRAQLQSLQAQQTACEEDLRALQAAQAQRKKAQLYDAKRAAMQAANRENAASAVCARLPREDALAVLAICALEMVLHNVPAILVMGIFRAGGDTRYGLIIDCITMYLIGLPLTMLTGLYLHWSVPMTYLVMYLSEDIVKCAAYLLHYRSGKWIRPVI